MKINLPTYEITLYTSFVLWFVSLCLPAVGSFQEVYWGYELFIQGIISGWIILVFQPWTNVVFLFIGLSLLRKKNYPNLAILNFLISLTSFMYVKDQPNWHWGAVCWFIAYFLIIIACFQFEYKDDAKSRFNVIPYVMATFIVLFMLSQYQHKIANSQEKNIYYTKPLVAFVARKFINFPYQPMDEFVFKEGDLIEFENGTFDVDYNRFENSKAYSIPVSRTYVYQQKIFLRQNFGYRFTKDLGEQQPDYKIAYYQDKELKGVKVSDKQQIIWQGLFKKGDYWPYQKPDYANKLEEKLYKTEINRTEELIFNKSKFKKMNFSTTQNKSSTVYTIENTPFQIIHDEQTDKPTLKAVYQNQNVVIYITREANVYNEPNFLVSVINTDKMYQITTFQVPINEQDFMADKWDTLFSHQGRIKIQ